jgi:hypothetical protein
MVLLYRKNNKSFFNSVVIDNNKSNVNSEVI